MLGWGSKVCKLLQKVLEMSTSLVARKKSQSSINYEKLQEICQRAKSEINPLKHEDFMKEYPLLFVSPEQKQPRQRSHTLYDRLSTIASLPQVERPRTVSAYSWRRSDQIENLMLRRRLRGMASVSLKYPPFRNEEDVKKLSSLLLHFPELLPTNMNPLVREKIAAWIIADRITEKKGISLPREGGLYIILKGRVQETHKDLSTGKYTMRMLHMGEIFGEMKEMAYPPKLSYPTYVGEKSSIVLRITLNDIKRAKEMIQERQLQVHLQFIETSPLLKTFPLHIRQKLAMGIEWKDIPAKTKVLIEGEPILSLSIIKEGKCKITKSITNSLTSDKVCIGELCEGACIGELIVEGCEISPYTITSLTPLHVGQIAVQCIRALNLEELLTAHHQYSVTLPSEEMLQKIYAEKQMDKQWNSLKRTIIEEVYKERQGIRTKSAYN